jgi:hypothetical protein
MDRTDVMKTALESEYVNFDTIFSFKGDKRQLDEIEELSKKWGCSRSLLVRQAIAQFLFKVKEGSR